MTSRNNSTNEEFSASRRTTRSRQCRSTPRGSQGLQAPPELLLSSEDIEIIFRHTCPSFIQGSDSVNELVSKLVAICRCLNQRGMRGLRLHHGTLDDSPSPSPESPVNQDPLERSLPSDDVDITFRHMRSSSIRFNSPVPDLQSQLAAVCRWLDHHGLQGVRIRNLSIPALIDGKSPSGASSDHGATGSLDEHPINNQSDSISCPLTPSDSNNPAERSVDTQTDSVFTFGNTTNSHCLTTSISTSASPFGPRRLTPTSAENFRSRLPVKLSQRAPL